MTDDRWTEMDELMLRRTTLGLSEAEMERLMELLDAAPEEDRDWIDRLVGELDAELAERDGDAELPEGLRRSLLERADVARAAVSAGRDGIADPSSGVEKGAPVLEMRSPARASASPIAWVGWAAAAVFAGLLFVPGGPEPAPGTDAITVMPDRMERALAIADRADAVRIPWTATEDPTAAAGVTGEVVWSDEAQAGFMRFAGLAANDPSEFQYQLWIFDAARDERFPVDGGVFDVPAGGGEVVIPIDARLPVDRATLFAVTVEAPGGVVVSDRSRIAVLARSE